MAPVDLKRPLPVRATEQVVAVTMEGKTKAFTFDNLRRSGVVESKIKKNRFVVFHYPDTVSINDARRIARSRQVGSVGVFSPELDGKRLKFRRKKGKILDKETGSTWNLFGVATDGPMAGKRLRPVDHRVYYAFALMAFQPRAQIVGLPARSSTADGSSSRTRRSDRGRHICPRCRTRSARRLLRGGRPLSGTQPRAVTSPTLGAASPQSTAPVTFSRSSFTPADHLARTEYA